MDISKNLTFLRKNRDLSRQELSDIIGISVHTYIKYENGSVKPPYETLCKLADYYKVKTDQILGREEMPNVEYNAVFESELIEQYKRLPKDIRATILQAILNAARKCERQEGLAQQTMQKKDEKFPKTIPTEESEVHIKRITVMQQNVTKTASRNGGAPVVMELTEEQKDEIRSRPRADEDM